MREFDVDTAKRGLDYPPLRLKDENAQPYAEELVALTVTGSMMESREFSQRLENWLNYYLLKFFETAREFNFSKVQEIGEVIFEIFKTISLRGLTFLSGDRPLELRKEEKERLLKWNLLLDRYGEEDTEFILDLVEEATSEYARTKDEIGMQHWIVEKTGNYLKEKDILDPYAKEKYWE
jgi:hypothetical protein